MWGIPKQIQKAITNLTKFNTNRDTTNTKVSEKEFLNESFNSQSTAFEKSPSSKESSINHHDFNQLLNSQRPPISSDNSYARNFDLVLRTSLKYDHLFLPEEAQIINAFLKLDTLSKTIYARMFFRKRFWYTHPSQLKSYAETDSELDNALKNLYKAKLLKSDEDSVYETDYEKIHELFECM